MLFRLFLGVLLFLFCCSIAVVQAQRFTINGTIKDATNGEELIGASVYIKEKTTNGTSTNAYGYYSLTLEKGTYTLAVQYIGYQPFFQSINLNQSVKLDIELKPLSKDLVEVEVKAEREDQNVLNNQMGVTKLDIQEIKDIPMIFGERDILKTITLLPGIKSAGEGQSGFFVRGGGIDQNLVLLDEALVYNASHLLGFFSVFNSDAIKELTVYKGNMPAEFGGRLSSVVDIRMREGNQKKFSATGGIGLIASRLTIEAPIVKDKGSFILSARRTYADLFLKLSPDETQRNSQLYFYDFNAKANYRISEKDRVFISGYFGRDKFGFNNLFGLDYGNGTGTLRWNHIFNSRLFKNTTILYSDYDYRILLGGGNNQIKITSRVRDWNLKQDWQYFINTSNTVKFGLQSIYHTFIPGVIEAASESGFNNQTIPKNVGLENALYAQHETEPIKNLKINYGIRLSTFSVVGPGTYYSFNSEGRAIDSVVAARREFVKTYINPEPRVNVTYIINETNSVKASFSRNVQNLHLLSNSTVTSPTDRWIPTSINVKPEVADQVAAGWFSNFFQNKVEFNAEVYYKRLLNQIDYKPNADLRGNASVEADLVYGIGRAYGTEFLIRKRGGKVNGWISYTLSRTERKFDEIDNGKWFAARQDRTHDLSIVAIYNIHPKWTVSANWVYWTGNAVTFPSGKYTYNGNIYYNYTERNGYRMPHYHRLDIGLTWNRVMTEKRESSWALSIYNAYARENAYIIDFREENGTTKAFQIALFRLVPSITYNFKF